VKRRAVNARLWAMTKQQLPGGEETLRDLVALLRQEDGTGRELAGTVDYCSTRLLTDAQLYQLLEKVKERAEPKKRRRADAGNVTFLISVGERRYINVLRRQLGWSEEALAEFGDRQTKARGLTCHEQATAVIEPMERMLREKGWVCTEEDGHKWWAPPGEAT
jgi:hypothetical protein